MTCTSTIGQMLEWGLLYDRQKVIKQLMGLSHGPFSDNSGVCWQSGPAFCDLLAAVYHSNKIIMGELVLHLLEVED